MKTTIPFLIIFLVASSSILMAQKYTVDSEQSTLSVIGTSTLHDWKIKAETLKGRTEIVMTNNKLKDITSLTLQVPVADMHSGLNPMDVHMRTAMTTSENNTVTFNLLKVTNISANTIGGYTIQADGELSIIGNVKVVSLQATVQFNSNGSIRFLGKTMIDMTKYDVELPQAEMGSIKSEKDVKIVFDVVFKK